MLFVGQMAPGTKRRMPERLAEEARGFQLMDISFRSFQISNGWNQVRCIPAWQPPASRCWPVSHAPEFTTVYTSKSPRSSTARLYDMRSISGYTQRPYNTMKFTCVLCKLFDLNNLTSVCKQ